MKKKEVTCLANNELGKLSSKITSERDYLILQVMYETGCTVNELVNIKVNHLNFKTGCIKFPSQNTKSHKTRISCVSSKLMKRLKKFIENDSKYLFSSRQSKRITTKRVRQLLSYYSKGAGISKVTPQMIRYTHIAHAFDRGLSMAAVQKQVGMEKLRIVQIHEALVVDNSENVYEKFWRNG